MERKITFFILVFFAFTAASANSSLSFEGDSLTIYPNPAKEYLKLELRSNASAIPVIQIIDLTGKTVLKFDRKFLSEPDFYKAELDVSKLNAGIYFVKVIQDDKTYSKKLVVK